MKLLRIYQEPITSGRDIGYLQEGKELVDLGTVRGVQTFLNNPNDEYYQLKDPLTPREVFWLYKEAEFRLLTLEEMEEKKNNQEKIEKLKKELNKLTNCGEES